MTLSKKSMHEIKSYEPLFNYGHLRGQYLNSVMTDGYLYIKQFVRPEHISTVREQLAADKNILSSTGKTELQRKLSPVSRQCLWELHSGIMLRVLENITGLHNLLPDTYCKQTHLLPASSEKITLNSWHDPSSGLDAALVLIIQTSGGDAEFCTTAEALAKITTDNFALQVTYWQHNVKIAGVHS